MAKQLRIITSDSGTVFKNLNTKQTHTAIGKFIQRLQVDNERAMFIFEKI